MKNNFKIKGVIYMKKYFKEEWNYIADAGY